MCKVRPRQDYPPLDKACFFDQAFALGAVSYHLFQREEFRTPGQQVLLVINTATFTVFGFAAFDVLAPHGGRRRSRLGR